MFKKRDNNNKYSIALLVVGGILTGVSYLFMQYIIAWFCLVPLFYVLEKVNIRQTFIISLIYGIIASSILFYWIFPVANRYTGIFSLYSILFYITAVIYFSLYFAFWGIGYKYLYSRSKRLVLAGISISGLFVLIEIIKIQLLPGLPWFHYNLAITQAYNLWAIQWASIGGLYIIIFIIVFINFLLTQLLLTKETLYIKIAFSILVIFYGIGFYVSEFSIENSNDKLKVILLNENISAETRWNDFTGDSLANILFKLNKNAVKYNPDLIIWSETAIPWKFEPDDDFIPKVLSITRASKADHLFGILSPSLNNKQLVYNSAYLIKNDGEIADRYDKTILLDFLERPFSRSLSTILPFLSTSRYDNILPGKTQKVIKSGKANIGVLICNESLSEDIIARYIKEKSNLLVLMSNDAWFENTPLQIHHFYITRMEAVMSGRDIVVNSNRGIIGIIREKGVLKFCHRQNLQEY